MAHLQVQALLNELWWTSLVAVGDEGLSNVIREGATNAQESAEKVEPVGADDYDGGIGNDGGWIRRRESLYEDTCLI